MFHNEPDSKIENQIMQLFGEISFSKVKNRKVFAKWKASHSQPTDFSSLENSTDFINSVHRGISPPLDGGYQGNVIRHSEFLESRKELARQLEEIARVLKSDGEDAAEKLLIEFTQILHPIIKYFAFTLLILSLGLLFKAMIQGF